MYEHNIVCDIGTSSLKLGYANERTARQVIPSVVGHTNTCTGTTSSSSTCNGDGNGDGNGNRQSSCDYVCGTEAVNKTDLKCTNPIQGGCVHDWAGMEALLDHSIKRLGDIDNSKSKILITEPSLNPPEKKKKMLEMLFETMDFGAVNISNQALLCLYAQGLLTGMVIECGEGVTQIVPVYQGFVSNHLIKRFPITGNKITSYLSSLSQHRCNSNEISNLRAVKDMKEKFSYAAIDLDQERRLADETTVLVEKYTLPDGSVVKLDRERFECTEAYFDPSLVGIECKGLSDYIFDVIQECDLSTRKDFYQHMVLSGGSSMFPGMANRLQKDIQKRYLNDILKGDRTRLKKFKINVEAPSHRQNMVFLGGCVVAGLSGNDFWLSKADYEEKGIDRALSDCKM